MEGIEGQGSNGLPEYGLGALGPWLPGVLWERASARDFPQHRRCDIP
jgi:hypothetical protein